MLVGADCVAVYEACVSLVVTIVVVLCRCAILQLQELFYCGNEEDVDVLQRKSSKVREWKRATGSCTRSKEEQLVLYEKRGAIGPNTKEQFSPREITKPIFFFTLSDKISVQNSIE